MKQYLYVKGQDPGLDRQFGDAQAYGQTKLGQSVLFWKRGLKWYAVDLTGVRRIYRRVEFVYGKLCLGGSSYDIQRLALELPDGTLLEVPVGDRMEQQAKALMEALQSAHPEIQYGKA